MVGVVIPTVQGRYTELRMMLDTLADEIYLVIPNDGKPCGVAWNKGVADLLEIYEVDSIVLAADDIHPITVTWLEVAPTTDEVPAAFIYGPDDRRQHVEDGNAGDLVPFSRVPWITAAHAREMFPLPVMHYYNDCLIGDRLELMGVRVRLCAEFAWKHLSAAAGRRESTAYDLRLYERARAL